MRTKSAYDGGEQQGHCAVTAMHEVAQPDWSADDVMQAARECGFPSGRTGGWALEGIDEGFRLLGLETERTYHGALEDIFGEPEWMSDKTTRLTLARFMREHPRGVHYVVVTEHALVIRDGRIVDPNWAGRRAARRRVLVSWEIRNAGPGKYRPATQS